MPSSQPVSLPQAESMTDTILSTHASPVSLLVRPLQILSHFLKNPVRAVLQPLELNVKTTSIAVGIISIALGLMNATLISIQFFDPDLTVSLGYSAIARIFTASVVGCSFWNLAMIWGVAFFLNAIGNAEPSESNNENQVEKRKLSLSLAEATNLTLPLVLTSTLSGIAPLLPLIGLFATGYLTYAVYGERIRVWAEK